MFQGTDSDRYLVCLTIGPAFISASIYLCLSRLVVIEGTEIARFAPKFYTLVFICCDIVSLVLQAAGGALAAQAEPASSQQQAGVNVMIAGLATQVASLALFAALALDFALSVRRIPKDQRNQDFSHIRDTRAMSFFPYGT